MFDTHCHLNFNRFKDILSDVVTAARRGGVSHIVIPGTDVESSQKAVEIAEQYENMYAAVGIHPHHVFTVGAHHDAPLLIEALLQNPRVVAVGEIGIDCHSYKKTKYEEYAVTEEFLSVQKELFEKQIRLAIAYDKSVIIHNREAKADLLPILSRAWDEKLRGRSVFHCCEPDDELLTFAKEHGMYLGVDGDITYTPAKQEFIKRVPLEMLVLETDAPFLLPEPLRSEKKFPNEPKNLPLIADCIAKILTISTHKLATTTMENSKRLFGLQT